MRGRKSWSSCIGFRLQFKDGHRIHGTDISKLRTEAEDYARQRLGWKFTDVLRVEVTGDPWREVEATDGEGFTEIGIKYTKYHKVVGEDIFFDLGWSRWYGRGGSVIPWTVERELALINAIAGLTEIRGKLSKLLDVKKAAATLDAAMLGKLLPAGASDVPR